MEYPQDPTTEGLTDGVDPANPGRSRTRRLVAVATGTTLALGAGGIAYAATSNPTPTPTTSSSSPSDVTPDDESGQAGPDVDGDHPDGDWGHGPGVAFGGFGALHGEFVVETSDGVYGPSRRSAARSTRSVPTHSPSPARTAIPRPTSWTPLRWTRATGGRPPTRPISRPATRSW